MNIKQMQYEFQMQMNQFNDALQLDSDDVEYWLNKAQIDLVKERYNGYNRLRRGFEQSQERIDDLRVLIERDHQLDTSHQTNISGTTGFEADVVEFPADYMFLISQKSRIYYKYPEIEWTITDGKRTTIEGTVKFVSNRVSQSDDIYKLLNDPFNKPKPSSPISVVADKNIYVFTDKTFIVDKILIDYLRLPREMKIEEEIDCELPSHLHKDIIQRAVDAFLNNTRELKQRLQRETPVANNQQNETEQ